MGLTNMDLKKGLTYIARGYLFVLLDFSLDLTDIRVSIDILPDFIGWFFIFIAIDCLGEYITDRSFTKWTAIAMVILTILEIFIWPEDESAGITILYVLIDVISTACLYTILGAVEKIARDFESPRETTIRKLKGFLIVKLVVDQVIGILGPSLLGEATLLIIAILIVELIYSISIAVNLNRLRDEVTAKIDGYY